MSESATEQAEPEPEDSVLLGELVPDHALAAGDRDLLDHLDFINRLEAVIEQVSVFHSSANIVLYGSWGSGKSGIANGLRARLKERESFVFVEIDAFKFGRRPLLRNFIRRIAEQVPGIEDVEEQMRPLYETTSRPHLRVPSLRDLSWPRLLALQAMIAVFTLLVVCWVFGEGRPQEIAARLLPSTALIGGVAALLAYFTTTRTKAPPEGDEQFEQIFRRMLADGPKIDRSSDQRLVVFIDELDRCAPSEVASTLESLRTFLGVEGCIFIVAADQQVLEHALTRHLRQATPPDLANPYYSAGSAYLDKIFQYQLSFPPIRSRRLNHFALELLEGRGGVWAEPGIETEDVVSVLIPTHVQSPRRVKVLLNGFALTFGVAQARAGRKNLPTLAPRARELAKLVCLKLEFPLFARELGTDHRLPAAVLLADRAARGDSGAEAELAEVPHELRARAELYAAGKLPVASILSGGEDHEAGEEGEPEEDHIDEPGEDHGSGDEEDGPEGLSAEEEASVQGRHAVQLVRYLEKTANIPGPGADLIHLESAGAVWGIDPQVAEELELDARDNRGEEVARKVAGLEPGMRLSALLMLSRLAREEVGQDADNVIRSMLAAASELDQIPATIAAQLLGELDQFEERRALSAEDLKGALDLATAAGSEFATERYLSRVQGETDHDLSLHVLGRAGAILDHHSVVLAQVTAYCVRTEGERAFAVLEELGEELASGLLVRAGPEVVGTINGHFKRVAELESEGNESQARGHTLVAQEAISEVSKLAGLFSEAEMHPMAELAALPLFGIDKRYETESRFQCLAGLEELETVELSAAVLELSDQFAMSRTLALLRALDPEVVAAVGSASEAFDRLGAHIWNERVIGKREVEGELRGEIERLLAGGVEAKGEVASETIASGLAERLESASDVEDHEVERDLAFDIAELGLLDTVVIGDGSIGALALSIKEPVPDQEREQLVGALRELADEFAPEAGDKELEEALRVLQAESWLADSERLPFEYLLLAALAPEREIERPALEDLWEAISEERAGEGTVGIWISHFAAAPLDAFSAAEPFIEEPAAELLAGIRAYAEGLQPKQLSELCISALEAHFARWPAEEFFEAAEMRRADDRPLAEAIAALSPQATNPEHRRRLLDLWEWLSPSSGSARKQLIQAVFLPIAASGTTGHELARKRLELVARPPRGMKEEIVHALRRSAPDDQRRQTLERRLAQVGLAKKGIFDRMFGG